MINGKKILVIIPARAGSKRVKDKNIKELAGKPLIAWTIDAAKKSKYVDYVYVSTDSEDIQGVTENLGIDASPLRSIELASDTTSSIDVVLDIINNKKKGFDIIVLLQPTSPLRSSRHIDEALELFCAKEAKSVVSVCETETHPSWSAPVKQDLFLNQLIKNLQEKRSQDLETHYRLNGALYISTCDLLNNEKSFFAKTNSIAYKMGRLESVDIDTVEEFQLADLLLSSQR